MTCCRPTVSEYLPAGETQRCAGLTRLRPRWHITAYRLRRTVAKHDGPARVGGQPIELAVEWITYAQSLTQRPVKGMLTGPVTILAWSFVRDDQPLAECARADCATRRSAAGLRPRSEARIEDPRRACGVAQG